MYLAPKMATNHDQDGTPAWGPSAQRGIVPPSPGSRSPDRKPSQRPPPTRVNKEPGGQPWAPFGSLKPGEWAGTNPAKKNLWKKRAGIQRAVGKRPGGRRHQLGTLGKIASGKFKFSPEGAGANK